MTTPDPGYGDLRAERTARELARINKRLDLLLMLATIPYALAILGLVLALAGGGDVQFSTD